MASLSLATTLAGGFAITGCGGDNGTSTTTDGGGTDSSSPDVAADRQEAAPPDAGMEAAKEAAPDVAPEAGPDATADVNPPPDAGPDVVLTACATPTFMPAAGMYMAAQSVTISTTTPNATIYYTTNDTNPTSASAVYSSAIAVSQTENIRAMCNAPGYTDSMVGVAAYTITIPPGTVASPVPNPAAGTVSNDFLLSLTTSTSGATICFTLDGSTPTCNNGACQGTSQTYNAQTQIPINGTVTNPSTGQVTVNALACKAGSTDGTMPAQQYTLQVATPALNGPAPGALTYTTGKTLAPLLSTATNGAVTANYTTDPMSPPSCTAGTNIGANLPTNFPSISEANGATTYLFAACKAGYKGSAVYTATYTFNLNAPTFTPAGGNYDAPQTVTIDDTANGGANDWVCYTTDATTASCGATAGACGGTGAVVAGTVSVKINGTGLSAIACGGVTGHLFNNSQDNASGAYVLTLDPLKFTPPTGTPVNNNGSLTVGISQNGTGQAYSSICYSLDGTTPDCTCNNPGHLTQVLANAAPGLTAMAGTTISAIACDDGSSGSQLASVTGTASYQSANTMAQPSISPGAAQSDVVDVTFTNNDAVAARICYTTDGSAPSPGGACTSSGATTCIGTDAAANGGTKVVTGLVTQTSETVKAVACDATAAKTTSSAASTTYIITVAAPQITPAPGAIAFGKTASWTSTTVGAQFAYTLDGTTPNCSGASNTTSVQLTNPAHTTLKVIACDSSFLPSAVTTNTYSYFIAAPAFTPDGTATYTDAQSVAVANPPSDFGGSNNVLCYTLNGSTPTCTNGVCGNGSTTYTAAVAVSTSGTTLKAIACNANGLANSAETDATYTLHMGALGWSPDPATTQTAPSNLTVTLSNPPAATYLLCTALGTLSIPPQPNTCTGLAAYLNTGLTGTPWTCATSTATKTASTGQSTSTPVSAVACKDGLIWTTSQATYTFNPYSHTINASDGINDFSATNDKLATNGGTLLAYLSFDATNLYIGYSGFTANDGSTIDAYFGDGTTGVKTADGLSAATLLPENLNFHLKWVNTASTATIDQYASGAWGATMIPVTVGYTGAGSQYVEFAIARTAIGFGGNGTPLHISGGIVNAAGTAYVTGSEWPSVNTSTLPWTEDIKLDFSSSTVPNMSPLSP